MALIDPDAADDDAAPTSSRDTSGDGDRPDGPATNVDNAELVDGATDNLADLTDSGEGTTFEQALQSLENEMETDVTSEAPESLQEEADSEAVAEESAVEESAAEEPTAEAEDTAKPEDVDEGEDVDEEEVEADADAVESEEAEDTEEETEAEAPDRVEEFVGTLNETYDDLHVDSLEDVQEELERERQGNDAIVSVIESHPEMQSFLGDVLTEVSQNGTADLDAIARDHFEVDLPDPEEDEEAYREALREREKRRAQREQRRQQLRQVEEDMEELAKTAQRSIKTLAEDEELSDSETKQVQRQIADFINNPSEEFAKVIYRGLNFDSILEEERKQAKKEGRNEAIRERREKKEGDGVAKLRSSDTSEDTTPDSEGEEESPADLAQSLQRRSDPLAELTE